MAGDALHAVAFAVPLAPDHKQVPSPRSICSSESLIYMLLSRQINQSRSMWNWTGSRSPPNPAAAADDDAWEARALAEDAACDGGLMGTTWPPRSYSCTFCRREFKSAQALGGHMNVHRRDRAKLRSLRGAGPAASAAQPVVFPALPHAPPPEFVANGGILLIYPIGAGAGAVFAPAVTSPPSSGSSLLHGEVGMRSSSSPPATKEEGIDGVIVEELDLELRLGR